MLSNCLAPQIRAMLDSEGNLDMLAHTIVMDLMALTVVKTTTSWKEKT